MENLINEIKNPVMREVAYELLKQQAWAKQIDGKFHPMLANEMITTSAARKGFDSRDEALAYAKEIQMLAVKDLII